MLQNLGAQNPAPPPRGVGVGFEGGPKKEANRSEHSAKIDEGTPKDDHERTKKRQPLKSSVPWGPNRSKKVFLTIFES